MASIQEQLQKITAEYQTLEKVARHLTSLSKRLDKETKALHKLSKKVDREQAEYERLESLSLKSLFHKVLGNKEEQVEKERQEYLQSFLKYNEAKKSVELMEFEMQTLEKKLARKDQIEAEMERLIKLREKELLKLDPSISTKLQVILHKQDKLKRMHIEVREALQAGDQVLHSINTMIGFLNQARNWGHWDMSGRSHMPSYMKKSSIDKAVAVSHQVKHQLHTFSNELQDVYGKSFNFPFHIESFSGFMDIFFDNLISDWIIQKKIKNSLASIVSVRDKVIRLVSSLKAEMPAIEKEIEQLEQNHKEIIINA